MVATGTVKWFNLTKGCGLFQPQDGGRDVFVHISVVERAGLSSLKRRAVRLFFGTEKGRALKRFWRKHSGIARAPEQRLSIAR
jgi:cold shock CspA family protein